MRFLVIIGVLAAAAVLVAVFYAVAKDALRGADREPDDALLEALHERRGAHR